jgi:hypothetical protein
MLRRICEPKKEEVTGGWRKLIMKLYNLYRYYDGDHIKKVEMGLACSMHGEIMGGLCVG